MALLPADITVITMQGKLMVIDRKRVWFRAIRIFFRFELLLFNGYPQLGTVLFVTGLLRSRSMFVIQFKVDN